MEFDGPIEDKNISLSLINSLRAANKKSLKSISIPDMSVGITRFPPEKCADILFTVIKYFIEKENKSLDLIEIVLWDIETLHIYRNIYKGVFQQGDQ